MKSLDSCATITLALALLAAPAAWGGEPEQVEPTPGLTAFTGARLIIGDGETIESGTIVARDGVIEAVGGERCGRGARGRLDGGPQPARR